MLVIVNYGVGNLNSIRNILHRAGHESMISDRLSDIQTASQLLLPGMGHFDNCMQKFAAFCAVPTTLQGEQRPEIRQW